MWKRRTEGSPQGILVDILTRLRVLSYPKLRYIAKGSISRKKMRLKEKMQIENMTLDDFIKQF